MEFAPGQFNESETSNFGRNSLRLDFEWVFLTYALLNCQNHTNHQKVIESHFFSRFRPVGSTIFIHSVSVFQFARRDHSGGNTHIQHTNGVKK